ncbi:NAD(P)/FAD-dependent oxidoreductase [Aquamicrobium defluvii]|uniref:Pyridine nucleotide-disulfide oxidoreductase n=1 Tax=Aquamicrobium defluvii TaxID=69279 RepID=A0A011TC58_9HYPH|nr:FAD/NAD(P)-binding oxidoreductase [Aquamicrobium defluvii]EXL09234.1 pyridine nucleotide-disulfide oxidoreductase [Aquamicrobium defluvii]EZQ17427.1 pyridine nucleotide-disulfide oxidoreductase [Halopseudomonas bauzanensis]TDR37667.1 sulfide:quinone oxidoreductase [Aquamicrobium defluvii]
MTKHILVVGGGIGGTMTANSIVAKLYPEVARGAVKVTLLSDSPWHYYKPAFMYVAFDMFFEGELRRKQQSLLRPEIDFRVDKVTSFDFAGSKVKTQSGKTIGYDYIVVSTGCLPAPERIPGLKEAGDYFYQQKPALQMAEKLRNFEKGRIFITVNFPKTPNVPHQCGIAPVETTLMLDEYLRRKGVRDQVEIVYTYPTVSQLLRNCLFLQQEVCEVMPAIFESKGIKYQRGFTLASVDPERKVATSEEGKEEGFDLLMCTPPIRAVDAVLESGVSQAANNEGWLPTNRQTLQLEGFPNAYVMGDTVDLPISKAGGSCHNQCPVVVNNIAGDLRLGRTVDMYDGKVQAVAQMGLEAGMPLWYDYDEDVHPTPPTKVGGLLRKAFNRGIYWSVARGII